MRTNPTSPFSPSRFPTGPASATGVTLAFGIAMAIALASTAERSRAQADATTEAPDSATSAATEATGDDASEREMLARAARLAGDGRQDDALAVLAAAVERFPSSHHVRSARADLLSLAGRFADAEADLTAAIESHPDESWLFQRRGEIRFFAADIDGSLPDFDRFLGRYPERRPYHWQRGLALYYARRFEDGVAQFELHRTVNPDDVENAVWHFLCLAAAENTDAARQALIPYTDDQRVPMKEIHDLFAGTGTEQAVLDAATRDAGPGNERRLRNNLCYAHLYLGLYHEAMGHADQSLIHIRKAAIDHAMPHYMGRTAQVHLALRVKDRDQDASPPPDGGDAATPQR